VKNYLFILFGILFLSCKTTYLTKEFKIAQLPMAPDYSQEESWAVLPHIFNASLEEIVGEPQPKKADVFFIYPTLFVNKKDAGWNADIYETSIRTEVLEKAVTFQASAWVAAANLYVPFYRQAHYRIFVEPYAQQGKQAGVIAYEDVKNAFVHYLENYNHSKPIIIAAHSQGTIHAKRLLKEFFDGKPLQKQLIAAYLIGSRIIENEFKTIPVLEQPEQFGGFVSWNTYKINHLPKQYEDWYKGGVVTNPITWDQSSSGPKELHLGVLASDKRIYPKSLSVEKTNGLLWSTLPKIKKRFLLSFIKNYHFADVNLFWKDIQQNAILRTENWLTQNQK
jgi:hypothetical protein